MNNIFTDTLIQRFDFLIEKHAFRLKSIKPESVTWTRSPYEIDLLYDRYSHELGLLFGHQDQKENFPFFDLDEMVMYAECNNERTFFQSPCGESLEEAVCKIANLLNEICERTNLFSTEATKSLADIRDQRCNKLALAKEIIRMREEANVFWKEKNYGKIIEIYAKYKKYLTLTEKKRYEYAMKQIF